MYIYLFTNMDFKAKKEYANSALHKSCKMTTPLMKYVKIKSFIKDMN